MNLELDKEDLVRLVLNIEPNIKILNNPIIKPNGSYNEKQYKWGWYDSYLRELSEQELWEVYLICKQSWL